MKSNLPEPDPSPPNPEAEAIMKKDGLYFLKFPSHPIIQALEKKGGIEAVSFCWVQFGRIYSCTIDNEITPDRIPPGVTFTGPFLP